MHVLYKLRLQKTTKPNENLETNIANAALEYNVVVLLLDKRKSRKMCCVELAERYIA